MKTVKQIHAIKNMNSTLNLLKGLTLYKCENDEWMMDSASMGIIPYHNYISIASLAPVISSNGKDCKSISPPASVGFCMHRLP